MFEPLLETSVTVRGVDGLCYIIPSDKKWFYDIAQSIHYASFSLHTADASGFLQECFYRGYLSLEVGQLIANALGLDYEPLPF